MKFLSWQKLRPPWRLFASFGSLALAAPQTRQTDRHRTNQITNSPEPATSKRLSLPERCREQENKERRGETKGDEETGHKTKDFISQAHLDVYPRIVIVEEKWWKIACRAENEQQARLLRVAILFLWYFLKRSNCLRDLTSAFYDCWLTFHDGTKSAGIFHRRAETKNTSDNMNLRMLYYRHVAHCSRFDNKNVRNKHNVGNVAFHFPDIWHLYSCFIPERSPVKLDYNRFLPQLYNSSLANHPFIQR